MNAPIIFSCHDNTVIVIESWYFLLSRYHNLPSFIRRSNKIDPVIQVTQIHLFSLLLKGYNIYLFSRKVGYRIIAWRTEDPEAAGVRIWI